MKAIFTVILLIFITTSSFGQEYRIEYGNKRYMNYHYVCSHDNGFTLKKRLRDGKYVVYSKEDSDLILIEGYYKNRRKTGRWTIYDPYERSIEYQTYENGNLLNESGIDSLGRKTIEVVHTKDSIIGVYYGYHRDDVLRYKEEFWQSKSDSTSISRATYYYINGQLKSIYNYKNGEGHGEGLQYFENGQLEMQYRNFDGKPVGLWRWWNAAGELVKEKDYNK